MKGILLFFMVFSIISCKKEVKKQINAEDLLISGTRCLTNTDCRTGLCRFDMCVGMLVASRPMDRLRIGRNIKKICASRPELKQRLLQRAISFLQTPDSDAIVQGRAAETIGLLCKGDTCKPLTDCLSQQKDPLRFYCAIGLALAGNSQANKALNGYKNSTTPVRKLARFFQEGRWKDL